MPSITGISMSRTTTSTSRRPNSIRAASPWGAEPTTRIAGSSASCRVIRPRTIAESSTTRTLIWPVAGWSLARTEGLAAVVAIVMCAPPG